VDLRQEAEGRAIHGEIGRNRLGVVVSRATPTTVVGTKVIRGTSMARIEEALDAQADWWGEREE
jgi:hypothetical protein